MREILNVEEIQSVLFDALCYFDDFCRANELRYFLSNGTLLGAVKYGKFIPWDDDVDILMPREDYDRLMGMEPINNGTYRLLCGAHCSAWRMPYAKLSCEKTSLAEGDYDFGVPCGLSVDIFPIDRWSSCLPLAYAQAWLSDLRKRTLVCAIGGEFASEKRGLKRLVLKMIYRMGKRQGHARVREKIEHSAVRGRGKKPKYVGCRCWTCHRGAEVLPAACFFETVELSFCGRKFPTFAGYVTYLDRLYGSWREELSSEQQHSNHEIKVWWKDAE